VNSDGGYAWIAMDNLQLTGAVVSGEAPEPGTWSTLALSLAGIGFITRRQARRC